MAGHRVWIDRRRLRGGVDFWDEIERVLRQEALKQIVVFTENVRKDGVKKELAIGNAVRKKIADPKFMIPVRASRIEFEDAPPEFLRDNIINAHPNWHDCLKELFETLAEAKVPRTPSPDTAALSRIVEAREDGRRFVVDVPRNCLRIGFRLRRPRTSATIGSRAYKSKPRRGSTIVNWRSFRWDV
jgi:hypothetical protein